MQRLRDTRASDPIAAEAARLLESVSPLAASAEARDRVRRRIRRPRRATLGARLLRPALVAGVLVGSFTAASAMLGRGWMRRDPAPAVAPPPPAPTPSPAHAPRRSASPVAAPPVAAPLPVAAPPAPAPSVAAPRTRPIPAAHPAASPIPPAATPPRSEPPPAAPDPDVILVTDGIKALNQDHDPTRAGELVERYLRRHPDGELAEEALAIAIAAAAQRGDARAAALGAEYLARFPGGRFEATARRARTRFSDDPDR